MSKREGRDINTGRVGVLHSKSGDEERSVSKLEGNAIVATPSWKRMNVRVGRGEVGFCITYQQLVPRSGGKLGVTGSWVLTTADRCRVVAPLDRVLTPGEVSWWACQV